MRLAPVAIRYWRDPDARRRAAIDQSRTTHAAPEAVSACAAYADMLAAAIAGTPRSEVMRRDAGRLPVAVSKVVRGSWRGKPRAQVNSSGYVVHSLEAALWSVGRTATFREAALAAANLGEDADTTAAIAGQLAGALYGASSIPEAWLDKLAWRERIEAAANRLFDQSLVNSGVHHNTYLAHDGSSP
jgi:ADP-ribosyl-[dinitrogen reductase] hydrolase